MNNKRVLHEINYKICYISLLINNSGYLICEKQIKHTNRNNRYN